MMYTLPKCNTSDFPNHGWGVALSRKVLKHGDRTIIKKLHKQLISSWL